MPSASAVALTATMFSRSVHSLAVHAPTPGSTAESTVNALAGPAGAALNEGPAAVGAASSVRICLVSERDHLYLTVSGDGVGCEPQGDLPGHRGLQSMRERASSLGATLRIRRDPGHGTTLEVRLPTP